MIATTVQRLFGHALEAARRATVRCAGEAAPYRWPARHPAEITLLARSRAATRRPGPV